MKPPIVYCHELAYLIKHALQQERGTSVAVQYVGPIQFDLNGDGAMVTTTKTLLIKDTHDTEYIITIEEKNNAQKNALQQKAYEHSINMLRNELLSCETTLQQERSLRANA